MNKVVVGKNAEIPKFNKWFHYCEDNDLPFIKVRNGYKYSEIEWDHISLNGKKDFILDKHGKHLIEKAKELFHKYKDKSSSYSIGVYIIRYCKISIDKSEQMANELYDIIESILKLD